MANKRFIINVLIAILSVSVFIVVFISSMFSTHAVFVSAPQIPRTPGDTTSSEILDATILDSDISSSTQIMYAKLKLANQLVDNDISTSTQIQDAKLNTISTAGKVSGAALTLLGSIPAGAGTIPAANVPPSVNQNTYSARFDGTANLSLADNATTSITGNMTLEAWVQFPGGTINDAGVIVSKWAASPNKSYCWYHSGATMRLDLSSTGSNDTDLVVYVASTTPGWNHYAFVYTAASGQVQIYVNGVLYNTITGYGTSIADTTAAFNIGGSAATCSGGFTGAIDEVRLWNIALTAAQIADSYQTETASSTTGSAGQWTLDNVLTDKTGGNPALTNNSSVIFTRNVPLMR